MELDLTKNNLIKKLNVSSEEAECISLYLPTHAESRSETINEDELRFKNLLGELKQVKVIDKDLKQKSMEALEEYLDSTGFWTHQKLGLAMFVHGDEVKYVKLPYEINSFMLVDKAFITSPLQLMQAAKSKVFVLHVNLDEPQLFSADTKDMNLLEDANLPGSIEDALRLDEFQQNQQFHTGAPGGAAMYHGHGGADDNKQVDIENFLSLLAKKTDIALQREELPLILAGPKERISFVRKKLHYKHLIDNEITGNFEKPHNNGTLLNEVQKIIAHIAEEDRRHHKQRYEESANKGFAVEGIDNILIASEAGNVDTLYVPVLRITRDSVREGMAPATKYEYPQNPEELAQLEDIIAHVRNQGGNVLAVEKDETSKQPELSAVLRREPVN